MSYLDVDRYVRCNR